MSLVEVWAPLNILKGWTWWTCYHNWISWFKLNSNSTKVWSQVSHWSWEVFVGVVGVFAVEISEWVDNSWCSSILEYFSVTLFWAPFKIMRVGFKLSSNSTKVWSQVSHWGWQVLISVVGVFAVEISEWVDNGWCSSILEYFSISFFWAPFKIMWVGFKLSGNSTKVWSQVSDWGWEVLVSVVGVFAIEISKWVDNCWCSSILKYLSITLIWAPFKIRRIISLFNLRKSEWHIWSTVEAILWIWNLLYSSNISFYTISIGSAWFKILWNRWFLSQRPLWITIVILLWIRYCHSCTVSKSVSFVKIWAIFKCFWISSWSNQYCSYRWDQAGLSW